MRRAKVLILGITILAVISTMTACGCTTVHAGNVGVKVYLLGTNKGVDNEVLGVGRYWLGINEEIYTFPTYTVNYVWTKDAQEGSPNDESITFQTKEGLTVNGDVGISYAINPEKVSVVFQKYRKGIEEITDTYLRNMVRDAFNQEASVMSVESVYGSGKSDLIKKVESRVKEQVSPIGIDIEKIYFINELRLPETVVTALNSKIEATQRAQQRENELREAEAEAKKTIAIAEAEAKAIRLKQQSITPTMVQYEAVQKWDGKLPEYMMGNSVPFIQMK